MTEFSMVEITMTGRESADEKTPRPPQGSHGEVEPSLAGDPIVGKLRELYDDVASQPLPDNLASLLAKLDEAERNR